MEDAKDLPHDTGDTVKSEGEKSPSLATLAGDANECENNFKKLRNEAKNRTTLNNDVKDQVIPMGGAVEPKNALISAEEHINVKSENEDTFDAKTKSKEPIGDESAVEKQVDNNAELIKPNAIKGEVSEEIFPENSMEDENHVKNVSEEIAEEMPNCVENVPMEENNLEDGAASNDLGENILIPTDIDDNRTQTKRKDVVLDEVPMCEDEKMEDTNPDKTANDELKEQKEVILTSTDVNSHNEAATPNSLVRYPPSKAGDYSDQTMKPTYTHATLPLRTEDDDGTPEEQAAFTEELESFYRERGLDFKPPKFYGQPLNCLKLWRAVIRLGGYERVTGSKLWRQVGESFHPPKTCTTVSWTFRIFYEKSLLEYEKYKIQSDELQLPVAAFEASGVSIDKEILGRGNGHQGSEPGRVRRDAAARAMQGWHSQRNGGISEPVVKNKNPNSPKSKKNFKSIGSLKQKRPNELETSNKVARTEISEQLVASVIDVGPPADWVKVNVRPTADCFEVYALVPGLLREEVKVQSDPAGRLVITGQPEQVDNPWGVTPFKKVVSLPARIDPLNTSAVVSLHGGLFVRVPYELHSN